MDNLNSNLLQDQIQELLHASIRVYNLKEDDAVSLKTLKLMLVGTVLEVLGLEWTYIINLFKTHTPIHPEIGKELKQLGDEEVTGTVAQIFVRNEKLVRLLKVLGQHGKNMEKLLAVDGLGGNVTHGPNFEQKHYVGNLRYGDKNDPKMSFDLEPEYKRRHVQTVRDMYDMLGKVKAPEKHIYEILRRCFEEIAQVTLQPPEWEEHEKQDAKLWAKCGAFYMKAMGREHVENVVKSLKRFRGEKRTREEEELPGPNEKMTKLNDNL